MKSRLNLSQIANSNYTYLTAILLIFFAMLTSRLYLDGFVQGLDYGIFFPDGVHYAYRTLKFIGLSDLQASEQVANWFAVHGNSNSIIEAKFLQDGFNPVFHIVKFRILYSILSIPFVSIFGIMGMVAVPILVTLTIFLLIGYFGHKTQTKAITLVLVLILSISFTFPRWMISDLSDPLMVGLFFLVIPTLRINSIKLQLIILSVLILLSSFTRLSTPYWVAIGVVLLIQRKRVQSMVVFILGIGLGIPVLNAIINGGNSVPAQDQQISIISRAEKGVHVLVTGFAQLMLMDRLFLILLVIGFTISALNITKFESQLVIAVFVIGLAQEIYVGEVGVNLRYELPAIPFMIYSIQSNYHATLSKIRLLRN
jgi:hypothetical protein